MHYSTIVLSALAVIGTLATPTPRNSHPEIAVTLANGKQTHRTFFDERKLPKAENLKNHGPWNTIEITLSPDVKKKDLRCQAIGPDNKPLFAVRGQNLDTTFADGGKGKWTFQHGPKKVIKIICDPKFKANNRNVAAAAPAASSADNFVIVQLSDGDLATQANFNKAGASRQELSPTGSSGPYNSVTLLVGKAVKKQDLRCQILDTKGKAITVKRGANVETTFGDGGKGAWTFLQPTSSKVGKIICDPAFVKS